MKLAIRTWLKLAWHFPRRQDFDLWDNRARLIGRLAPGKTFIDVGGMWGVHGRAAFLAEEAGAERVLLLDAMPASEEFHGERRRRGSEVSYRKGDLHHAELIEELGSFDVVWCTGVVYHTPHPFLQLHHLRRLARERLLLGSVVIPEVPGLEQACVFYPRLSDAARTEFARFIGTPEQPALGITTPYRPEIGYANFWWGLTPSALRALLDVAGFDVTEEHSPTPFLTDFLASAS